MKAHNVKELGQRLRARREQLGLSASECARRAGIDDTTVIRIESGFIAAPQPEKLARLAEVLDLNLADLYALVGYPMPKALPALRPYLRSKYRDLPIDAVDDLTNAFERIIRQHGYDPDGPAEGQDEAA